MLYFNLLGDVCGRLCRSPTCHVDVMHISCTVHVSEYVYMSGLLLELYLNISDELICYTISVISIV